MYVTIVYGAFGQESILDKYEKTTVSLVLDLSVQKIKRLNQETGLKWMVTELHAHI